MYILGLVHQSIMIYPSMESIYLNFGGKNSNNVKYGHWIGRASFYSIFFLELTILDVDLISNVINVTVFEGYKKPISDLQDSKFPSNRITNIRRNLIL